MTDGGVVVPDPMASTGGLASSNSDRSTHEGWSSYLPHVKVN